MTRNAGDHPKRRGSPRQERKRLRNKTTHVLNTMLRRVTGVETRRLERELTKEAMVVNKL